VDLDHAWALGLLAIPVLLLIGRHRRCRYRPALAVGSSVAFRSASRSPRVRLAWLPFGLRLAALTAMALAVARPRTGEGIEEVITQGVDIVLAIDVSGSMRAEDFRPNNRLHVAKEVVRRFIDSRSRDRLGLVVFAGRAFTQCPLTVDYDLLKQFLTRVDFETVDQDGTAIGMALGTALNRLRRSDARSRVVVLVTDGINNRGALDPLTAAQLAAALGIKVYTVGVGTEGAAPIPVGARYQFYELPLDERTLSQIAEATGGFYFRAHDPGSFAEALERIGKLETSELRTRRYVVYDEYFPPLLGLVLVALGLEGALTVLGLGRLP